MRPDERSEPLLEAKMAGPKPVSRGRLASVTRRGAAPNMSPERNTADCVKAFAPIERAACRQEKEVCSWWAGVVSIRRWSESWARVVLVHVRVQVQVLVPSPAGCGSAVAPAEE